MNNLKAILFDFDGTLAHSGGLMHSVNETLEFFGFAPLTKEHFESLNGRSSHELYLKLQNGDEQKALAMRAKYKELQFKHMHLYELVAGARDTLHILKCKYKLGIVTTANTPKMDHLINKLDLQGIFDYMVTSDMVTHVKPNPEPFEKALQALGVSASEAIMVGDTQADIEGARNAGTRSVLVDYFGASQVAQTVEPDFIVKDFREILNIVK